MLKLRGQNLCYSYLKSRTIYVLNNKSKKTDARKPDVKGCKIYFSQK